MRDEHGARRLTSLVSTHRSRGGVGGEIRRHVPCTNQYVAPSRRKENGATPPGAATKEKGPGALLPRASSLRGWTACYEIDVRQATARTTRTWPGASPTLQRHAQVDRSTIALSMPEPAERLSTRFDFYRVTSGDQPRRGSSRALRRRGIQQKEQARTCQVSLTRFLNKDTSS